MHAMKAKKTITIDDLKARVNHILEHSVDKNVSQREGVSVLLSKILMDTGNYSGFNYLETETDIHGGVYGKDNRIFFY
jgi:hypothetical protein